jgi:hypothetical protein
MLKSLGVATALALLALAVVSVTPAAATSFYIESCTKEEAECKPSSAGTEFEATSEEFVVEEKGEVINECTLSVVGEVIDSVTEKEGDDMELAITSAEFTECSFEPIEAEGLPWIGEVDAAEYEATGLFQLIDLKYSLFGCYYATGGTHFATSSFESGKGFQLTLTTGTALLTKGWFLCSNLTSPTFHSLVLLLGDAGFPQATEIRIG